MSIEECLRAYPDVPLPIMIKTEALRLGTRFSPEALAALRGVQTPFKGYTIFSGDRGTTVTARERIPHTFTLEDATPVAVRVNVNSPYYIHYREGEFSFTDEHGPVAKVGFIPAPSWLNNCLEDGTAFQAIAFPSQADKILCTLHHYCEFWKFGKQCLFCDSSWFLRVKKRRETGIVAAARPEQVARVLGVAFQESGRRHLTITGGTVLSKVRGKDEVSFFCDYLNAIREAFGGLWWSAILQIVAHTGDELRRLRETGIPGLAMNMEVWDRNLFQVICPGKAEYIGWEEWQRRMFEAVELFGRGRILSNFVAGVEMARPFGFKTAMEAVKSTLQGFDYLMSHGVLPRKDYWTPDDGSALKGQQSPPLEYFIELERGYLELRLKHGFSFPYVAHCRSCTANDVVADWDYHFVKLPEATKEKNAKGPGECSERVAPPELKTRNLRT
ncbi:MAG: hypothetical protein HY673_06185 [Chloroflexi bacterium]|nr:hypothetical protein [Chloroflexota bacterium]